MPLLSSDFSAGMLPVGGGGTTEAWGSESQSRAPPAALPHLDAHSPPLGIFRGMPVRTGLRRQLE